jgi:hypothetical protein
MKEFAFTLLGLVSAFGSIAFYQLYRDSAPTPDDAVRQYVARVAQNAPQKLNAINVVSSSNAPGSYDERLLLFRATDPSTRPFTW